MDKLCVMTDSQVKCEGLLGVPTFPVGQSLTFKVINVWVMNTKPSPHASIVTLTKTNQIKIG